MNNTNSGSPSLDGKRCRVLTTVGPDQRGIVKNISRTLHECGCNVEDSRMALLAGQFAIVMLYCGDEAAMQRFDNSVSALNETLGYPIQLTDAGSSNALSTEPRLRYRLHVSGIDQSGIVHRITDVLASAEVNVLAMDSKVEHAAFTGTAIFHLNCLMAFSSEDHVEAAEQTLGKTCDELNLALTFARDKADADHQA